VSASNLRKVFAVTTADLRRSFRDRLGLVFVFLLPFVFVLAFGLSNRGSAEVERIGIAGDGGAAGATLYNALTEQAGVKVERVADREALEHAVDARRFAAGIAIPDDLSTTLAGGRGASIIVMADPQMEAAGAARLIIASVVAEQNSLLQAAHWASDQNGSTVISELEHAQELAGASPATIGVRAEPIGSAVDERPLGFERTATANLVLFIFLNSVAAAGLVVDTRRLGIFDRIRCTVNPTVIIFGQLVSRLALALIQAVVIIAGCALLFGVRWGSPVAVAAVVTLFCVVSAGAATLTSVLVRGNRQRVVLVAPPVAILLGMLGGCMWPLWIVPSSLRTIGHVTPHAWAVDALSDVAVARGIPPGIAVQLAVLAGFAIAFVATSVLALRREVAIA